MLMQQNIPRIGEQEISQGSAWAAAPGQGQAPARLEQLIWVVQGHQSLHQRLSTSTAEITEENRGLPHFPSNLLALYFNIIHP